MSDTISRQDAIEALIHEFYSNVDDYISEKQAVHAIDSLPSAHPEQKKGEWINRSLNILYPAFERYTCSVCGKHSYSYDFCPHCGADMRGSSDD